MKIVKNLFLFIILIAVIAISFWFSFMLGKNLLTPTKKIPTADLLTMEASVLDEIGRITLEVEAISKKALSEHPEPEYMKPKVSGSKIQSAAYIIQSGLFSVKSNAKSLVQQLKVQGFNARYELSGKYFKVFVPAKTLSDAKILAQKIREKGFEAVVRRK